MAEPKRFYEWGYRVEGHEDEWQGDYGTDGSWTSYNRELGIEAIDIYDGTEEQAIRRALASAHVEGEVIRRLVTVETGPAEVVLFNGEEEQ
jgi:hypothetical protein